MTSLTPLAEHVPLIVAFFIGLGTGIGLGMLIAFTAAKNIARRRNRRTQDTKETTRAQ